MGGRIPIAIEAAIVGCPTPCLSFDENFQLTIIYFLRPMITAYHYWRIAFVIGPVAVFVRFTAQKEHELIMGRGFNRMPVHLKKRPLDCIVFSHLGLHLKHKSRRAQIALRDGVGLLVALQGFDDQSPLLGGHR